MKPVTLIKPCLEITWQKAEGEGEWVANYELVLPVHAGDIRDGEHHKGYIRVPISKTKTHVTSKFFPVDQKGVIETPFRDFSHARWDARTLGIEAWVVYGDQRQRISPWEESA